SLAAVVRMGTAVGSRLLTNSVVIIGTSKPSARIAATALGRSSAARCGATCPPLRTVRSIPANPARLALFANSCQVNWGTGFENRQRVPRKGPRGLKGSEPAERATAPAQGAAADTCRNPRLESRFPYPLPSAASSISSHGYLPCSQCVLSTTSPL